MCFEMGHSEGCLCDGVNRDKKYKIEEIVVADNEYKAREIFKRLVDEGCFNVIEL